MLHTYRTIGACLRILPDGTVQYRYTAGELTFEFSLLAEVGRPWQPVFRQLLDLAVQDGWTYTRGQTLDHAPWCADTLT